MNPNIYAKKGFKECPKEKSNGIYFDYLDVFKFEIYKIGVYEMKVVYKNGHPDPGRPSNSPYSY